MTLLKCFLWSTFSPHTLHLEKKVEVFPAEAGEVLQVRGEVLQVQPTYPSS